MTTMNQSQFRTHDGNSRVTAATWSDDLYDHQSRYAEVALALLPASLILATATALLVALL